RDRHVWIGGRIPVTIEIPTGPHEMDILHCAPAESRFIRRWEGLITALGLSRLFARADTPTLFPTELDVVNQGIDPRPSDIAVSFEILRCTEFTRWVEPLRRADDDVVLHR